MFGVPMIFIYATIFGKDLTTNIVDITGLGLYKE